MTVRRLAAEDCIQSCGLTSKGLSLCLFELNYRMWGRKLRARTQLKDVSNRAQKWNVGPEHRKERETFLGCFGKRTPFLRLRAQLKTGYEGERLATIHSANCGSLDWYAARDSGRVVRTYQEMDVGPVSPSSTTKDVCNHTLCHLLRAKN